MTVSNTLSNIYHFAIQEIVLDFVDDLQNMLNMSDNDDILEYISHLENKYQKRPTLTSLLFKLKRMLGSEDFEEYIQRIEGEKPYILS